ncbi:MAG: HDIG domain-containing protein [Eubacteriales bacterium]|nr:HDIG domain-containing protein [Eubacteriales bacterium]
MTRELLPKYDRKSIMRIILILLLVWGLILLPLHFGSKPKTYDLKLNDVSPYDIEAPRSVIDVEATERRAQEAKLQVANKMYVSDTISTQAVNRVRSFLEIVNEKRNDLYGLEDGKRKKPSSADFSRASAQLISALSQNFELPFEVDRVRALLEQDAEHFSSFKSHLLNAAVVIMKEPLDQKRLQESINRQVALLDEKEEFYREDIDHVQAMLRLLLEANVKFNQEATDNARQDAYEAVKANPILINRGTRIISQGDIVTPEKLRLLSDLNLSSSSDPDWRQLAGEAVYVFTIVLIAVFYLLARRKDATHYNRMYLVLFIALYIPFLISAYLGKYYNLAPPVYFTTVVLAAYFGFELSVVMSTGLLLLVLPFTAFNAKFFVVAACGILVAAALTRGVTKQDSFAKLILGTVLVNIFSTFAFSLLNRESWQVVSISIATTVISALVSVVAAIGLMPLFEFLFNAVSPLRLIDLSQPGHPLLKRLFLEAPGTSQHSMMVANLADSAAEAIGANALICRVGAYYHDVGKLENPLYFTENQVNVNPHDQISARESYEIITRHPEASLEMGRKYRLPIPVLQIAHEHHGTTLLQYFYHKAKEEAKEQGLPEPNKDDWRYHTPLPSTRESAVVMLADSTEAAMKSAGIDNLEEAESLMRDIFRIKIDQNQLVKSGLSFADIELILQAFLQVYSGHFHERIKYPEPEKEE